jgi:hypothetical protein
MWRLVRGSILLMLILFAANVAVLGAASLNYRDSFAPYAAIMPGNSVDTLKDYPCQWIGGMINGAEYGYCQFNMEAFPFGQVRVFKTDHVITRLSFTFQPDRLSLGDLILCWGKPIHVARTFHEETVSIDAYWPNQVLANGMPAQYGARPDYFLPITFLSIQGEWLPVDSERSICGSGQ